MIRATQAPWSRIERLGLAAALVLAASLMGPVSGYLTDDTFIHLQYARNLAAGQGLVFNVGERAYGCTSPLWVALIADGIAIGLDGLVVARVLGVLATLVSVALFMQLMRRTLAAPVLRALATVSWAGQAWMLRWSVSGMETPLAVALTLGGFVAFTEGAQWGSRPVRTGALWGLAALTRPELVLLLVLWCILLIVDARNRAGLQRMVFGMLPAGLIYGSWLGFARVYFGTFWPQTLAAKTVGGGGLEDGLANLWRQVRIVGATDGVLVGLLLLAVLWGGRRGGPGPRIAQHWLPWLWVTALPALYVARGVQVISRYLLVLLPILAWLAWRAAEAWWAGPDGRRSWRVATPGVLVTVLVLVQNLAVYGAVVLPQVRSFSAGLDQSLIRWGRWFERHAPPGASIATPDIGAIGYFSGRRIVDLAGLVTPQMIPVLEHEPLEAALAQFRFAAFARPSFIVDRAAEAYDLQRRSPYAACLTPIGRASVPNLGIARPEAAVYTVYRVDWAIYEELNDSP